MDIHIKQAELELAVRQYVQSIAITAPIKSVSFTATRGDAGIVAEVDVGAVQALTPAAKPTVALVEDATENADDLFNDASAVEGEDSDGSDKSSIFGA